MRRTINALSYYYARAKCPFPSRQIAADHWREELRGLLPDEDIVELEAARAKTIETGKDHIYEVVRRISDRVRAA